MGVCAYAMVLCGCASARPVCWQLWVYQPKHHVALKQRFYFTWKPQGCTCEGTGATTPCLPWASIAEDQLCALLSLQLSNSVLTNLSENPAQGLEHWEDSKPALNPLHHLSQVVSLVACKITIYCIDHFKSDFWRTFFQGVLIPLNLVAKPICFVFF